VRVLTFPSYFLWVEGHESTRSSRALIAVLNYTRVPLDKSEGVVKAQNSPAVFSTACVSEVLEDRSSETLTVNQLSAERSQQIVPPTIDTAKTAAMILLSESRLVPGRERPINPTV
jgi:hypothetical protein